MTWGRWMVPGQRAPRGIPLDNYVGMGGRNVGWAMGEALRVSGGFAPAGTGVAGYLASKRAQLSWVMGSLMLWGFAAPAWMTNGLNSGTRMGLLIRAWIEAGRP